MFVLERWWKKHSRHGFPCGFPDVFTLQENSIKTGLPLALSGFLQEPVLGSSPRKEPQRQLPKDKSLCTYDVPGAQPQAKWIWKWSCLVVWCWFVFCCFVVSSGFGRGTVWLFGVGFYVFVVFEFRCLVKGVLGPQKGRKTTVKLPRETTVCSVLVLSFVRSYSYFVGLEHFLLDSFTTRPVALEQMEEVWAHNETHPCTGWTTVNMNLPEYGYGSKPKVPRWTSQKPLK